MSVTAVDAPETSSVRPIPADDSHSLKSGDSDSGWLAPELDWFPFSIDPRSLAAFRVGFALVLLVDLWIRASALTFFYTDEGSLPRAEAYRLMSRWAVSLHLLSGAWEFQTVLFLLAGVCHLLLLFGYRTQTASILSWVLLMSLHRRNTTVLQGGDELIRCLAFWSMFVPLGARWSVDALLKRGAIHRHEPNEEIRTIPGFCLLMQVAALYLFSVAMKSGYSWQVDHTAIFYALSVDQLATPFGQSLLPHRSLLELLTKSVLALEQYGPLLALSPIFPNICRMVAVVLFMGFHLGLILTMELGPFPYICLVAWLLFLPAPFWSLLAQDKQEEQGSSRQTLLSERRLARDFASLFLLANVFLWNLRLGDFERWQREYPTDLNYIMTFTGLDQNWGMFSPYPMNWDGWYEIHGVTRSGRTVNLLPRAMPDDPLAIDRPASLAAQYADERWRKYMMGLVPPENAHLRPLFANALQARWRLNHPEDPLRSLEINYFQELTQLEGDAPATKLALWQQQFEQ